MFRINPVKTQLLFIAFLMTASLQAQEVIQVISPKGEPVPFATFLPEKGKGMVADASGKSSLTKSDWGKIRISAVGYESFWFEPTGKDTIYQIRLKESLQEMDEVVVTGNFEPQSARNSVYQVRALDQKEIEQRAPIVLQDVLNTQVGIRFSQDNAIGSSNMELLGMSGQNVKILIDGVPMVGRQGTSNEININQIDVNQIERIEIVEGPMSVVYGADALAGVINIITKKGTENKWTATAKIQEETVGDSYEPITGHGNHQRSISASGAVKAWNFGLGFSQNEFGGWKGDYTGRQYQWLPRDQNFVNGKIGWAGDRLSLDYQLDYLNETIISYGAEAPLEILDQHFVTDRWMHRLLGQWEISDQWALNWQGGLTDYSRDSETWVTNVRTGEHYLSSAAGAQSSISYQGYSWRTMANWNISPKFKLQPGVDLNIEKGSGERISDNDGMQDFAVFLTGEWSPSAAIQVRPGLRKASNSLYDAPGIIPSLNTKFRLSEHLDLRLAYAKGFRAPSIRELYFDFFDASHSIQGNPDLKAETSDSFNGSFNWFPQLKGELQTSSVLGFFYNDVQDRIAYGQDPENIQITTLFNVENYRTTGLTLNQTFRFKSLESSLGFSYIGRYNQISEQIEETLSMVWTPEITSNSSYQVQPWGLSVNLFYKYTGALPGYQTVVDGENISAQEVKLDGYHWMDFTLGKTVWKNLQINVGVKNLLNITQINSTATGGDAHGGGSSRPIGYGRSYFLGLTYQFKK
ncbi:TonB-dependent receptor [Algoriphagus vanfongensis]|uniref:TonB-dependent receptor n=1 Tax=Algoriphagus vanfongensis TaxID=426371 RepID=UPI0003FC67F5|nr:TonB-dependent receptor [Algoriphagus vanfongensis]